MKSCIENRRAPEMNLVYFKTFSTTESCFLWLIGWFKLILSCFVGGHIHLTLTWLNTCIISGPRLYLHYLHDSKMFICKIVPRILQQNVRLHVYRVRGYRHILYLVDEISCQLSAKPHQILLKYFSHEARDMVFRLEQYDIQYVHAVGFCKMQILVFFLHCVSSPQSHSKHDCRGTRFCLFSCVWNRMMW